MSDISFSVEPGFYLNPLSVRPVFGPNVKTYQYTLNGGVPAISKYIAYDNLVPPNPFIAVTQDGRGNVVYDGGFPKIYNSRRSNFSGKASVTIDVDVTRTTQAVEAIYYSPISKDQVTIANGDKLIYSLRQGSSDVRAGVDGITASGESIGLLLNPLTQKPLLLDQYNVAMRNAHLNSRGVRGWYFREFDLSSIAGTTIKEWRVGQESSGIATYKARFRDIYLLDRNGNIKMEIFKDNLKVTGTTGSISQGYTSASTVFYDPRAALSEQWKYIFNALFWCANRSKFIRSSRRVLFLGDANTGENYCIKTTNPSDFYDSLYDICAAGDFAATFKTREDYAGGLINPTASELEDFVAVFLVSSKSGLQSWFSKSGIDALKAWRERGNGIIMFTDHGPVVPDISNAVNPTANAFFWTANDLAKEFGAYFSGDYNRTPMNIEFLRKTYGDHPLYAGMGNSESIYAGGSESRIQVAQYPQLPATQVTNFNIPFGTSTIRVAAVLENGEVVTTEAVYNVVNFKLSFKLNGVEVDSGKTYDNGSKNYLDLEAVVSGNATQEFTASIRHNGVQLGTVNYNVNGTLTYTWNSGRSPKLRVQDNDKLEMVVTTPFNLVVEVTLKRFQPKDIDGKNKMAQVSEILREFKPGLTDIQRMRSIVEEISAGVPWLGIRYTESMPANIKLIRDYFFDQGLAVVDLPAAALKSYLESSRNWGIGDESYRYWVPVNPVTGQNIDLKYFAFSPEHGSETVPLLSQDYYASIYLPAGRYRIYGHADDFMDLSIGGKFIRRLTRMDHLDFTIDVSRYHSFKVSNENLSTGSPSWWTYAIINMDNGAVVSNLEPGVWKTQEY